MPHEVYSELRERLDRYSVGFPPTRSGVELTILKRLFTEEQAEIYLGLSMVREPAEAVAKRLGRDVQDVSAFLAVMAEKGLVFRSKRGAAITYAAAPYVVGIFEHQLKTMDRELAELTERYFQEAFGKELSSAMTPLRAIPVNASIDYSWPVMPYEDVREIIRSEETIAVANCICRVRRRLLEKACDKPLEVCFAFGAQARYYVEQGLGRWIGSEEALGVIDACDAAGLVPQPFNAQQPSGMCNCCGDCCDILRSIKMHPRPAERVLSNYYAKANPELCTNCETCLGRCQMEAITISPEGIALVDRDRCIGCGLCVTTCASGALRLKAKAPEARQEPPPKGRDTMAMMAQLREKRQDPV